MQNQRQRNILEKQFMEGGKGKICIQVLRTLENMKRMEWIFVVKRKGIQQSCTLWKQPQDEGEIMTFSHKQKLWICVVSGDTARNSKTSSSEGKEKIQVGNSDPEKERVPSFYFFLFLTASNLQ